jgi:hypothetical protein
MSYAPMWPDARATFSAPCTPPLLLICYLSSCTLATLFVLCPSPHILSCLFAPKKEHMSLSTSFHQTWHSFFSFLFRELSVGPGIVPRAFLATPETLVMQLLHTSFTPKNNCSVCICTRVIAAELIQHSLPVSSPWRGGRSDGTCVKYMSCCKNVNRWAKSPVPHWLHVLVCIDFAVKMDPVALGTRPKLHPLESAVYFKSTEMVGPN